MQERQCHSHYRDRGHSAREWLWLLLLATGKIIRHHSLVFVTSDFTCMHAATHANPHGYIYLLVQQVNGRRPQELDTAAGRRAECTNNQRGKFIWIFNIY